MSSEDLMYVNWREMIKPENIEVNCTRVYGKFVWEPLERGFGITIGNSLRRIILSSLYGSAIVSVKFDSVLHEYSVLPNVLEDVSEIIMNLKQVRMKTADTEPKNISINKKGPGIVTAADIVSEDGKTEILNPEYPIATLSKDGILKIDMVVKTGKGFSFSEANKDENEPVGTIFIDSVFSPIKKVNYEVGTARVGQKTDYDKLTMEVYTDGSVTPEDSVAYAAKILKEQMNPFINFDENIEPEPAEAKAPRPEKQWNENLYRNVDELELSVRSANCLKNAEIVKLYQLVRKTEGEMLKTKNFGRKSLNEIKEVLTEMGLSLGMNIDSFEPLDQSAEGEE